MKQKLNSSSKILAKKSPYLETKNTEYVLLEEQIIRNFETLKTKQ